MSLGVAIQSVIYYIAACSACHKYTYRRRRKREAAQAKADNAQIETEEPGLYKHPSPFSTNIYWREELALGPGPPQRKSGKKDEKGSSSRQLLTAGAGSSLGSSAGGTPGDSTEVAIPHHRLSGEGWNRRRYQREDEALWGHDDDHSLNRPSTTRSERRGSNVGSSVGVVGVGPPRKENYYVARNPPVNELHPPVVSTQPANRSETRWMLQPPPSAKIMNGKERATGSNRSRSDSGNSHGKRAEADGEHNGLGRQLGERLMEEKVRKGGQRGEGAASLQRRTSSKRKKAPRTSTASLSADGQPHDRENETPSFFDTLSRDSSGRRRHRPARLSIASSEESLDLLDRGGAPRAVRRPSANRKENRRKKAAPARSPRTPSPHTETRPKSKDESRPLGDLTTTFNKQNGRPRPNVESSDSHREVADPFVAGEKTMDSMDMQSITRPAPAALAGSI